jgi:hypothetical protein
LSEKTKVWFDFVRAEMAIKDKLRKTESKLNLFVRTFVRQK